MKRIIPFQHWWLAWLVIGSCTCKAVGWTSPDGSVSIRLESVVSGNGQLDQLSIDGTPLKFISHSSIRRENHGYDWIKSVPAVWIGNRFLAFDDDDGLCLVDAKEQLILLNQVFTAHAKSPVAHQWAAIRLRPTARNQEQLSGNENDTLWLIEPNALAQKSGEATTQSPFKHVSAVTLSGTAVARPLWSEHGDRVAVAKLVGGKIDVDLFDPKAMRLVGTVPLSNIEFSKEQLLSVWINPEVDQKVSAAMKSASVFDSLLDGPNSSPPVDDPQGNKRNVESLQDSKQLPSFDRSQADWKGKSKWARWTGIAISLGTVILLLGGVALWIRRFRRSG